MLAGYGLLRLLFGNLVGFGGYQGDELDAAFDQQVARIFGKSNSVVVGKDLIDDLLDSRWDY